MASCSILPSKSRRRRERTKRTAILRSKATSLELVGLLWPNADAIPPSACMGSMASQFLMLPQVMPFSAGSQTLTCPEEDFDATTLHSSATMIEEAQRCAWHARDLYIATKTPVPDIDYDCDLEQTVVQKDHSFNVLERDPVTVAQVEHRFHSMSALQAVLLIQHHWRKRLSSSSKAYEENADRFRVIIAGGGHDNIYDALQMATKQDVVQELHDQLMIAISTEPPMKLSELQAKRLMKSFVPTLEAYKNLLQVAHSLQKQREELIVVYDIRERYLATQRNSLLQSCGSTFGAP
mmetsp:Transcript_54893/g.86889  ORF Transcript_54893/g.86889 Transcript_54893/m.86889 type:complete len:294 (-) Transcript_54893:14-895(-)